MFDNQIKVLVVDDSAFMRKELKNILESDPEIKVIATARNGEEGLIKTLELQPDVVALDINMPIMDGLTMLQHIMIKSPRPCVIISSLTQDDASITFEALEIGAIDYVAKPSGTISLDISKQKSEIISKIKAASKAKLGKKIKRTKIGTKKLRPLRGDPCSKIVVIGVSTGGPRTLLEIIPKLPMDLDAGVIIAQHMPASFTTTFASRLNSVSKIRVQEAQKGDILENSLVLIAPGGYNMTVTKYIDGKGSMVLLDRSPSTIFVPCINILFNSISRSFGKKVIGVILTGMGNDGVSGLKKIREVGGRTIVEDENTAVVFGMPKEAIKAGAAEFILPVNEISEKIVELVSEI